MKWKPSAFSDDVVTLTWRDLLTLIACKQIKDGACIIRLETECPDSPESLLDKTEVPL